jgi:hypothetical protein
MTLKLEKHGICKNTMLKWLREQQAYRRSSNSKGWNLHTR